MFMVFTAAADDELDSIVESAFENVEQGRNDFFLDLSVQSSVENSLCI